MVGFEDTVLPEVERALIAGHDLVLLGERGQGKTRLIRTLVGLLDEWTPVLVGSELNEHPLRPISVWAHRQIAEHGDADPGRLAAPQRPVRREAGHPGHQRRRPDRRRRPDQGRRGPHAGRPGDRALRPGPAHQPRHLQRQRAARPRRAHPGRAAQRARGARHPDPRLPAAAAAGPAAGGQRQPRGLHQPRPDHHPAQGPLRRRGAHPLPARARRRDPPAAPGGADLGAGRRRPAPGPGRARAPGRDHRPLHPAGPRVHPRRPALRRQRPVRHRRRWRRWPPPPSAGPRSPGRRRPVARVVDLPSVVPASRGKVEFADSGTDPDDDRELEILEHLLRQATAQTFRARLRRAWTSPALQEHFTGGETVESGELVPAPAPARAARHHPDGWPSCWAGSASPRASSPPSRPRPRSSSPSRACT